MKSLARLATAFAIVSACSQSTAHAQTTNTYMFVPNIPGGSLDDRHKDWIDVLSLSQTWEDGKKLNSCDVTVFKQFDAAGPKLWAAAVAHQGLGEVKIEVVNAGGERPKLYEIRLTNARVSRITTAGSPTAFGESVTLSSDGATLTVFTQKPDGSAGTPVTATISCL